jgi:signal transduction histidine kinase
MLDAFIIENRDLIIARTRERVMMRTYPQPSEAEIANGIPVFLDQLCDALRLAKSSNVIDHDAINESAARHGHDLLRMGLTVAQVVRDYGDVCQAITQLSVEQDAQISGSEFRTLNLCLDDAIATAVTEYARDRERALAEQGTERLGILAHEMRNLLNAAMLSFDSIKSGHVAVNGSTGLLHGRALMGLRDLIDRSLTEVRLDAGIEQLERISVGAFIEEIEIGAMIEAQDRGLVFAVLSVDRTVTIQGDRQILAAAISNLLKNAFKFTRKNTCVSLKVSTTTDRVLFEVEDDCGGLPPGRSEELFLPFKQRSTDRSGVGLGLAICMRAAKANGGNLTVHDLPGKGCVFTLDLPRIPPPPLSMVEGGSASSPQATGGMESATRK